MFQSKGGSLYLGSSASNLRLVFYEKGYEQNKKYGTELDENWNRYEFEISAGNGGKCSTGIY